jgi:hypothetical protein
MRKISPVAAILMLIVAFAMFTAPEPPTSEEGIPHTALASRLATEEAAVPTQTLTPPTTIPTYTAPVVQAQPKNSKGEATFWGWVYGVVCIGGLIFVVVLIAFGRIKT